MLACSFLIESSSKLLVARIGIKARSSSILGRIRPLILEYLPLSDENLGYLFWDVVPGACVFGVGGVGMLLLVKLETLKPSLFLKLVVNDGMIKLPGPLAQLTARLTVNPGVVRKPQQEHMTFLETDHEIISVVILSGGSFHVPLMP